MILKKLALASALVLCMTILSGTAWADNIPIVNPSFDANPGALIPNCALGGPTCAFNTGPIFGWSTAGGGVWQPGTYFPGLLVGDLIGYTNATNSLSQQLTGTSALANSIYTLSVSVGDRAIDGLSGNYTISLDTILGGVVTSTLCSVSGNASSIASGTFQLVSCSSPSLSSVQSGDLYLQFTANSGQLDVDNVSLTVQSATGVPEPSSILLLGLGMLFLLSAMMVGKKREFQLTA
jgi:hapalindole biogenesis HpiC1 cyclase-like protein